MRFFSLGKCGKLAIWYLTSGAYIFGWLRATNAGLVISHLEERLQQAKPETMSIVSLEFLRQPTHSSDRIFQYNGCISFSGGSSIGVEGG
jgi:hypothetical protein